MKTLDEIYASVNGAPELEHLRTPFCKAFKVGDDKLKTFQSYGLLHYYDTQEEIFKDIDLTPVDMGDYYLVEKAPYILKVYKDGFKFDYESRNGGKSTVSLKKVGALDVNNSSIKNNLIIKDTGFYYTDVVPGLDLHLKIGTGGVEWYKVLHHSTAPKTFEWEVLEDKNPSFSHRQVPVGQDNKKSKIELIHNKVQNADINGQNSFTYTEEFTGRVKKIKDPKTRIRQWSTNVSYPVIVDVPDITESVAVGGDDGRDDLWLYEYYTAGSPSSNTPSNQGVSWDSTAQYNVWGRFGYATHYNYTATNFYFVGVFQRNPIMRFTTVNVPGNVTIDLAELKVNVTSVIGGGITQGSVVGIAEDDVAQLSGTNLWLSKTKTTSSTASGAISSTGIKTINVTNQVQEIVDRAGWSANNAMGMMFYGSATWSTFKPIISAAAPGAKNSGSAYNGIELEMYEAASANQGVLEITYTLKGAALVLFIGV